MHGAVSSPPIDEGTAVLPQRHILSVGQAGTGSSNSQMYQAVEATEYRIFVDGSNQNTTNSNAISTSNSQEKLSGKGAKSQTPMYAARF